jgi:hypothetical protein
MISANGSSCSWTHLLLRRAPEGRSTLSVEGVYKLTRRGAAMVYSRTNYKRLLVSFVPLWVAFVGGFLYLSVGQALAAVPIGLPDRLEAHGEIVMDVAHIAGLTLAVQPELALRAYAADKSLEMHAVWDEEGAGPGPYLTSVTLGETFVEVWGGGYRRRRWADDQNLVALMGTEHAGPRLRILHGPWGLDYTSQRTGVRWQWEGKAASGVRGKAGALVVAGLPPPEPEEDSDWNESLEDDVSDEEPVDGAQAGLQRGLERGVLFGTYQTGVWRLQGALAAAAVAEQAAAQGSLVLAQGMQVRYSPPGWRAEFRHSRKEAGYAKPDAVATEVVQWSVARANGRVGARLVLRQECESSKPPVDTWALSVSGRQGVSAAGIGSVYTLHQVSRAQGPAWRLHLQWHLGTEDQPALVEYPWIWSDLGVRRWQASIEARWPVGESGGLGARVCIAEAKNGRLSWSYPLFSAGRALSAQSHSGLRFEALLASGTEKGWRFLSELTVAEEVKHELASGELPRSTYWAWRPSWERELAEHVKLTLAAGVLMAQEYSGAHVEEVMQLLQLKIVL